MQRLCHMCRSEATACTDLFCQTTGSPVRAELVRPSARCAPARLGIRGRPAAPARLTPHPEANVDTTTKAAVRQIRCSAGRPVLCACVRLRVARPARRRTISLFPMRNRAQGHRIDQNCAQKRVARHECRPRCPPCTASAIVDRLFKILTGQLPSPNGSDTTVAETYAQNRMMPQRLLPGFEPER